MPSCVSALVGMQIRASAVLIGLIGELDADLGQGISPRPEAYCL
jgi:hypothetical protein